MSFTDGSSVNGGSYGRAPSSWRPAVSHSPLFDNTFGPFALSLRHVRGEMKLVRRPQGKYSREAAMLTPPRARKSLRVDRYWNETSVVEKKTCLASGTLWSIIEMVNFPQIRFPRRIGLRGYTSLVLRPDLGGTGNCSVPHLVGSSLI